MRERQEKSYLRSKFEKEEIEGFRKAAAHDDVIVPFLIELLKYRRGSCDNRESLLHEPTYPFRRAYLDGRLKELEWLTELLTEGDSNE